MKLKFYLTIFALFVVAAALLGSPIIIGYIDGPAVQSPNSTNTPSMMGKQ